MNEILYRIPINFVGHSDGAFICSVMWPDTDAGAIVDVALSFVSGAMEVLFLWMMWW